MQTRYKPETIRRTAIMGMLIAITILLAFTPLGFIPINPMMSLTIIHLPVLIGLFAEGLGVGVGMGLAFGIVSLLRALLMPTSPTDVLFLNPVVSIIPRLLIPFAAWGAYKLMRTITRRKDSLSWLCWSVGSFIGTLTNTVGVLGMIYLLYRERFAELIGEASGAVGGILIGTATTNGIAESILAMLVVPAIMIAITRITRKGKAA